MTSLLGSNVLIASVRQLLRLSSQSTVRGRKNVIWANKDVAKHSSFVQAAFLCCLSSLVFRQLVWSLKMSRLLSFLFFFRRIQMATGQRQMHSGVSLMMKLRYVCAEHEENTQEPGREWQQKTEKETKEPKYHRCDCVMAPRWVQ